MTERASKLKNVLANTPLFQKVNDKLKAQNKNLSDEIIELYTYVVDAEPSDKDLAGLYKQYEYMIELASNNYQNYEEIYDNVEAFARKVLMICDYAFYQSDTIQRNCDGLAKLAQEMNLVDQDYFGFVDYAALDQKKVELIKNFKDVTRTRNKGTHKSPVFDFTSDPNHIIESIFFEFWLVLQYKEQLSEARKTENASKYEKIISQYLNMQITNYQEEIIGKEGFKYIQIEYENAKNPEYDQQDGDFEVVRGTADTILNTIDFNKTPAIKIIAEAGMGKTKMLQYLNYKLSKDSVEQDNRIFPMLIICNDAKGDIKNYNMDATISQKLHDFLREVHREDISEKSLYRYLKDNYKVFFLLDGLNEINRSQSDKLKFINSLRNMITKDVDKQFYFLLTERYSREATTVENEVVFYRLSKISEEIKMEFFRAKGAETLFKRLEKIQEKYDEETRQDLNTLLLRPFYLTVFCDLCDRLDQCKEEDIPKNKFELMNFFVEALIKRENEKGETVAKFSKIRMYLMKMGELTLDYDGVIRISEVWEAFKSVTDQYGFSIEEYDSVKILDLFEQLGFVEKVDDRTIIVNELYSEYMVSLLEEDL